MASHSTSGPEPVPHQAMYFIYTLIGILLAFIVGWIIKDM